MLEALLGRRVPTPAAGMTASPASELVVDRFTVGLTFGELLDRREHLCEISHVRSSLPYVASADRGRWPPGSAAPNREGLAERPARAGGGLPHTIFVHVPQPLLVNPSSVDAISTTDGPPPKSLAMMSAPVPLKPASRDQ